MSSSKGGAANKPVHPKSRKARQIMRVQRREQHKVRQRKQDTFRHQPLVQMVSYFIGWMNTQPKETYTLSEMTSLAQLYVHCHDREIQELEELGKHRNSKESLRLKYLTSWREEQERHLSDGTFEMPDLTSIEVVDALFQWRGDYKRLEQLPMRAVGSDGGAAGDAEEGEEAAAGSAASESASLRGHVDTGALKRRISSGGDVST